MATKAAFVVRENHDQYQRMYTTSISEDVGNRFGISIKAAASPNEDSDFWPWEVWLHWRCGDDVGPWSVADFDLMIKTLPKTAGDNDLLMRIYSESHGTYAARIQEGEVQVGEYIDGLHSAMMFDDLKAAWYRLKRRAK